jgi:hypothetical protein
MVKFVIDRNTQRLKSPRRWMEVGTRGAFNNLFYDLDQNRRRRHGRFRADSDKDTGKGSSGSFFTKVTKDLFELSFAGPIHQVCRTDLLPLVHTHVQRSRSQKTKPAFTIFKLQRREPKIEQHAVKPLPSELGHDGKRLAKIFLHQHIVPLKRGEPLCGNRESMHILI